jgi:hypothetical protein
MTVGEEIESSWPGRDVVRRKSETYVASVVTAGIAATILYYA